MLCLVSQSCPTLCDPMNGSPPGSSVHGNSPGKNAGVGCHALLQGIFLTQGWNPGFPHCRWHCRQVLYHMSHQGSPWILDWVAWPFSRGSSWPRNQTGVSFIAGRSFTSWANRDISSSLIWKGCLVLRPLISEHRTWAILSKTQHRGSLLCRRAVLPLEKRWPCCPGTQ